MKRISVLKGIVIFSLIFILWTGMAKGYQSENESSIKYKGTKCSFNFVDTDLTHVLFFFAKRFKLNMVISPHIEGKVTVKLKDVPWDQALTLICKQHGLVMEWVGETGLSINKTNPIKKKAH